eukprot:TRINITY_DN1782_c0_g2_i1.p1 TRINITY_DN1782_c0_g2~~TRINITY_DN1782_c0_g2_i1.p1  ORF type:complete len:478 (+),score=212.36 TRINITY_DN1782_c0_g2_i1:118-1551(+)
MFTIRLFSRISKNSLIHNFNSTNNISRFNIQSNFNRFFTIKNNNCPFNNLPQNEFCISKPLSSEASIQMENDFAAHTYHPLPCVFSHAKGVEVWDPEGRKYFDFLSAYSAVNQGHCHPKIIQSLTIQAQKLTLSSRAFYSDVFPRFAKYACETFGYDMILPMNSGAEAVETAVKLAKKWGYNLKKIEDKKAIIIHATSCFHGRTMIPVSMSDDPDVYEDFGPYLPGFVRVEYNNLQSLEKVLEEHGSNVCGFLVEPIQGEAGVVIPHDGYLKSALDLCRKHNVLFLADEIQTGLGRTGKMLACDWEDVRPDILILGKALSGGVLPLSCVLADKDIMLQLKSGQHGSTFGGNPLASAVGIAALQVLKEEKLAENALKLGEKLRNALNEIKSNVDFIDLIRGKGLLNAIVINPNYKHSAWAICVILKENGLLCKPTHHHIIRLAPPLVINDKELNECIQILKNVFYSMSSRDPASIQQH